MFQRPVRAVTGLLLAIAVAGCALGPDYRTPPSKLAADFENAAGDHAQEPPREFWRRFDDPILNQLVEDALKANHDIRIAVANLQAERAVRLGVDAQAWPLVGASASGTRQVIPQSLAPGSAAVIETAAGVLFGASLSGLSHVISFTSTCAQSPLADPPPNRSRHGIAPAASPCRSSPFQCAAPEHPAVQDGP